MHLCSRLLPKSTQADADDAGRTDADISPSDDVSAIPMMKNRDNVLRKFPSGRYYSTSGDSALIDADAGRMTELALCYESGGEIGAALVRSALLATSAA